MSVPRKSSPMLERARQSTRDGRERAAHELLAWEKVEAAIREAAGKGFAQVTLAPPAPVEVRHTDQATQTETRLRQLGFIPRWEERPGPEPGTLYHALVVSWTG